MLTHDVEPIIDTIKSLSHKFNNLTSASFLKLSSGQITELSIDKNDIRTFAQICKSALNSDKNDIIKLIYLRRHYEIVDDKENGYQVLSNVLHKRPRAIDTREPKDSDDNHPEMNCANFSSGCAEICEELSNFSYSGILTRVSDANAMKALYSTSANGYEKLQIFRLFGLDVENSVIHAYSELI